MSGEAVQQVYASGECEIDPVRRKLRIRGVAAPRGGRASKIIELLARSAGDLASKAGLINRIWPGAMVLKHALRGQANAIRKALHHYRALLKMEPRRGYRMRGNRVTRNHDSVCSPTGFGPICRTRAACSKRYDQFSGRTTFLFRIFNRELLPIGDRCFYVEMAPR
jgi:DNA-binding winged helix-turn-helix (wHTH) protein